MLHVPAHVPVVFPPGGHSAAEAGAPCQNSFVKPMICVGGGDRPSVLWFQALV